MASPGSSRDASPPALAGPAPTARRPRYSAAGLLSAGASPAYLPRMHAAVATPRTETASGPNPAAAPSSSRPALPQSHTPAQPLSAAQALGVLFPRMALGPSELHAHAHARDATPTPASAPSSSASSPPSSSSSASARGPSAPHLHPPVDDDVDPPSTEAIREAALRAMNMHAPAARYAPPAPQIPEKCFSWCSQRNDAYAMCRMVCFRRRAPLPSKDEAIARLNGAKAEDNGAGQGFFAGLKHRLMPYSLIFVKGTPEGVVGRYMEELEGDDGQYDFGPLSRHAPHALRRKSTGNLEWFDWGDAGYLLHVPLTSLFSPIVNLPENAERVLGPPYRLLDRYFSTFTDGTQERALRRLADEITSLGAVDMVGRITSHYREMLAQRAEMEREREARMQTEKIGEVKPVKDKDGGKSE